jgi:YEATS domain-containing protein 4
MNPIFTFSFLVVVVSTYPFELNETGWGEFQAVIRVHFKDSDEQPIDLLHHLKLYPPPNQPPLSQKRVSRASL